MEILLFLIVIMLFLPIVATGIGYMIGAVYVLWQIVWGVYQQRASQK